MTTEAKKPSDYILGERDAAAFERFRQRQLQLENLVAYLDSEHERRQAWERSVEERLAGSASGIPVVRCLTPAEQDQVINHPERPL